MSTYAARKAEPGQVFTVNDWRGTVELTADARGIVRPTTDLEEEVCVGLGLGVFADKAAPAEKGTD